MKDVANMVVQQGEQLDHIEFNIKNTHQDVKDAEKEMISVNFIAFLKNFKCFIIFFQKKGQRIPEILQKEALLPVDGYRHNCVDSGSGDRAHDQMNKLSKIN